MSLLIRLALRNLIRHTRRTLLTTTVIVAGIGVMILGEGFVSGVEQNIVIAAEDGLVGHLSVRPKDYPAEMGQFPVDDLLDVTPEMTAFLDANTESWTTRVMFQPTLIAGEDWMRVRGIGYTPGRDEKVFGRSLWSIEGKEPATPGDEMMISPGLADLLDLKIGDTVVLQLRTHEGAINALDVTISGIANTTNGMLDTAFIYVPRELVTRLIASEKPSHVGMRFGHRDDVDEMAPKVLAAFGEQAEIITWQTETEELIRLQGVRRKSLQFLVFILMVLAAFGMANTILMAAYERVREVGTLRAMGMTRLGVRAMFLVEGAVMGLCGSVVGALWGGGLTRYWSTTPIDLTAASKAQGGSFSYSSLIYTNFQWSYVAIAIAFGTAVAILASVYPARVASNMAPADAVRAD